MKFVATPIPGAFVIEIEPRHDARGFFARTFCKRELAEHGLDTDIAQCNLSYNRRRGTLRGMHYQIAPHEEVKIVSCVQGVIFDCIVDIRRGSPGFGRVFSVELSAEQRNALYIPKGCAHGFQTLTDEATVAYQMFAFYEPAAARGIRWDDPTLAIPWPLPDPTVSERDAAFGGFPPAE